MDGTIAWLTNQSGSALFYSFALLREVFDASLECSAPLPLGGDGPPEECLYMAPQVLQMTILTMLGRRAIGTLRLKVSPQLLDLFSDKYLTMAPLCEPRSPDSE
jgi:hypothetical protein